MTTQVAQPRTDLLATTDWLAALLERCDFGLDLPTGQHVNDISVLLDCFSAEFLAYQAVIDGVSDAVIRNAALRATITQAAEEQGMATAAAVEAIEDVGKGALKIADDARELRGFSQNTAEAVAEAAGNLEVIDGALSELAMRLAQAAAPIVSLRDSTKGVAGFVVTLARLSRHAQLLAVNASIEAAHLAEAGERFTYVAQEVRKLSTSTHDSKADIAKIAAELLDTSSQILGATNRSRSATSSAESEITGAGEALGRTADGIEQFDDLMANYEAVTDSQTAVLEEIGSAIDLVAYHSRAAAAASRVAEQLSLDELLEQARERAGRWKLRSADADLPLSDTEFGRWIGSICNGADAAATAIVDEDTDLQPLVTSVRALIARVNAEQRAILADVVNVAVAISLNGYAWQSISTTLDGIARSITATCEKVGQWAAGAIDSVEIAKGMQAAIAAVISDQCGDALSMLQSALVLITEAGETVRATDGSVDLLNSAATRADRIMVLIESLSSETDLLSLNAAVEAAHAGDRGLGFSVIAEEIGSLARSTSDSTTTVSGHIANIVKMSGEFQHSIVSAAKAMKNVTACSGGVRGGISTFRDSFDLAIRSATDLAARAAEQKNAIDRVGQDMHRCALRIVENTALETKKSQLEFAIFGARAHAIAARRPIGMVIEQVRLLAESLCTRLEAVLDTAIANGDIPVVDLFTFEYRVIEGEEVASLARLFDVSRVPAEGFAPKKYSTCWDASVDEPMIDVLTQGWEEATAAGFAPVTIAVADLNGFSYAYPRQCIAGWTNDVAIDNAGNRIKRLAEDDYASLVVRCGLGPNVEGLGPRLTYKQFRDAGCHLDDSAERSWGAYVYARNPELACSEVVMGIYVGSRRHGTLRFCYDPKVR